MRKVEGLVGLIGLGLPEVEILNVKQETKIEFHLLVVMLLVEETWVIPTRLPIMPTPTRYLVIHPKFLVVVEITEMRRGRQSMIKG